MFNVGNFLDKFKNIGFKEILLKEKIVKVVNELTAAGITLKDVTIKNGIVSIKVHSLGKSELYMKKRRILEKINEGESMELKDIR